MQKGTIARIEPGLLCRLQITCHGLIKTNCVIVAQVKESQHHLRRFREVEYHFDGLYSPLVQLLVMPTLV